MRRAPWLWVLGCLAVGLVYASLTTVLWRTRSWPDEGVLAFGRPPLADGERLVPGGITAGQAWRAEHDQWGDCSDDTVYVVVGGEVLGDAYYAVYDTVDGDVCSAGLYRARDGHDMAGDAFPLEGVRVVKAGGGWRWVGTVKSPREMLLGGAFLGTTALQGAAYYGRWRPRFRWRRGDVRRQAQVLAFGVAAAACGFVGLDVAMIPDLLGAVVVGLCALQLLWCTAGARWLLAPDGFGGAAPRSFVAPRPRAPRQGLRPARWRSWRMPDMAWWRDKQDGSDPQEPTLSPSSVRVVERAPRPQGTAPTGSFAVVHTGQLPHFADVGGMSEVKEMLEDSLGLLLAFADEAADYRITFNGILLHGPPGTGKTFLAKALAGEFGLSFVHVTAADLATGLTGGAARRVQEAFDTAAANVPCVLFFDEFDALARDRASEPDLESRRTVAQLLTSLEQHRELRDLVVVAATNDLESLDPAVTRPGRFDRQVRVDLPDAAGRRAVLLACLVGRPVTQPLDLDELVRRTEGRTPALLTSVVESASMVAFREATRSGTDVPISREHLLQALVSQGGKDRPTIESWGWERLVLPVGVKQELQQIQRLIEDPELARAYGVQPPTGMLLAGPPGTGKTTIARVLAAEARCSFYPVSAADLTSKWVGESEESVRTLFRRARENAPSIVFIDEIDAVAGIRGGMAEHADRLVDQLLVEIDGLTGNGGVFVLGATNRPDMIDPALLRGGRLSRTVWLGPPDVEARLALLRLHAARMPVSGVDLQALADRTAGMSGADLAALCQQAALSAMARRAGGPPAVLPSDFDEAVRALQDRQHEGEH